MGEWVAAASAPPSVYLDTTVPSYLTVKRVIASPTGRNQLITYLMWHVHRARFRFFIEADLGHVAKEDCDHVAIAATNDMDYLATWNCTHLANPWIIPKVTRLPMARHLEPLPFRSH